VKYYLDEKTGEYVIVSGDNLLRLSKKEFEEIKKKKVSGILY